MAWGRDPTPRLKKAYPGRGLKGMVSKGSTGEGKGKASKSAREKTNVLPVKGII